MKYIHHFSKQITKGYRFLFYKLSFVFYVLFLFLGCSDNEEKNNINEVVLENKLGMKAIFVSNGARLTSLSVPDKNGELVDVVLGFDDPKDYDKATEPYFGATIGRYGNRIAEGKFSLDGTGYQLTINNGPNTLHGGKTGFQYQKWELEKNSDSSIVCTLHSPDGDNGFPGNLKVKVTYTLTNHGELKMDYEATTDKTTIINLTNHAFFNLNGSGTILNHRLLINADDYTPVDSLLIPTGQLEKVSATPFDFRTFKAIGKEINVADEQLGYGKGYDHNYVLNKTNGVVASVIGDKTGIKMDIYTTEPGLQFYSGNFMQSKNKLRTGFDYFRTGFCLETQHFPDSPNHANFPSTVLKPGEIYRTSSVYKFSVAE